MSNATLTVGDKSYALAPDFVLEALFSTVSYRFEPDGRASRFPRVMKDLFGGQLDPKDADAALAEMETIEREMKTLEPSRAIWNLDGLAPIEPDGQLFNASAANAFDFFAAADRRPLLAVLREGIYEARSRFQPARITVAQAASTGSLFKGLALILVNLLGGVGLTWWNWNMLLNEGSYYPKMAFISPLMIVIGIFGIFKPKALVGGNKAFGGKEGTTSKALLIALVVIALLAGGLNIYFMHYYYS